MQANVIPANDKKCNTWAIIPKDKNWKPFDLVYLPLPAKAPDGQLEVVVGGSWLRCWAGDLQHGSPHSSPIHRARAAVSPGAPEFEDAETSCPPRQKLPLTHTWKCSTGDHAAGNKPSNRCMQENNFKKHYRTESFP